MISGWTNIGVDCDTVHSDCVFNQTASNYKASLDVPDSKVVFALNTN